jgi:hypothetical protein
MKILSLTIFLFLFLTGAGFAQQKFNYTQAAYTLELEGDTRQEFERLQRLAELRILSSRSKQPNVSDDNNLDIVKILAGLDYEMSLLLPENTLNKYRKLREDSQTPQEN